MRFRTAIIWSALSQFGQSGITLLSTIILARMLTPDDFGIIGIVTIFIAFSQMMVDSEMGGALLRKRVVTRLDYSTLFYYNLAASLVIYAVLYFSAPLIADIYKRPELIAVVRVISLTIIIHAFRMVQRMMIFRNLKYKEYAVINVVSGSIALTITIILARKGFGYWALVWQQIILALCHVILLEWYNRFIPVLAFSVKSFKYQFSYGIGLLGSDIIRVIANNISTNIIAKISTLQFTGYYTQVSRITNFCQSTTGSLMDQCIFPMLSKYDDAAQVARMYYKLMRFIVLVLCAVTAVFIIFATPIIRIVLGDEWTGGAWMFQILSIAILPASLQVLCRNILKVLGETKAVFGLETAKGIIIIALLGIAAFIGLEAIVWAFVVGQGVSCVIWLAVSQRRLTKARVNGIEKD